MKFSEGLPCEIFWGRCCRKAKHLVMQFTSLSCRDAWSQRGGVTSFTVSIRVARAHLAGQGGDGAGPLSAVFAGVFRGFVAFIESMSAFADSVRMTGACGAGQRLDARISVPAVFAVELRHDEDSCLSCLLNWEDCDRKAACRTFCCSFRELVGLSG